MGKSIFCGIYLYGGIIEEVKVFSSKDIAKKWFDDYVEKCGGIDSCDPDWYLDGTNSDEMYFYDGHKEEVVVRKATMEDTYGDA